MKRRFISTLTMAVFAVAVSSCTASDSNAAGGYDDLLTLFEDWREFEQPPLLGGAPDYTVERFEAAYAELKSYQDRLNAIKPGG